MIGDIDPAAMAAQISAGNPDIRAIFEYWRGKAGTRRMPSRADIDPAELKPYLPWITLVDVLPDPPRLVYRLAGMREVEARGSDPTGKPVEEAFFGASSHEVIRRYNYAIDRQAPYYLRSGSESGGKHAGGEELIFLPLSDDGTTVNMVLVFVHVAE